MVQHLHGLQEGNPGTVPDVSCSLRSYDIGKTTMHPDSILLPSMNLHGGLVTYTTIRCVLMSLGSLVLWFWTWNRSCWPWGLLEQKRGQLSSRCCFHGQPRLQTLTGSTGYSPTPWIPSRVFNYPISCLPPSICAAVTKDANPRCLLNTENLLLTVLERQKSKIKALLPRSWKVPSLCVHTWMGSDSVPESPLPQWY